MVDQVQQQPFLDMETNAAYRDKKNILFFLSLFEILIQ
jgi:hypothetical protein